MTNASLEKVETPDIAGVDVNINKAKVNWGNIADSNLNRMLSQQSIRLKYIGINLVGFSMMDARGDKERRFAELLNPIR